MNRDHYSNIELTEIRERLQNEIKRRGTYKWFDPLCKPTVGIDKSSPLSIPDIGERVQVDDNTYSINNPSVGSIEETRNIRYPAHGSIPAGQEPDKKTSVPNTSAAAMNSDEMRNFIVGLAKIQDINLYYGRDEIPYLAFRDTKGIEDALVAAENSELHTLLHGSDISPTKNDPNGGIKDHQHPDFPTEHLVTYPNEDGKYVMPSGEYDGEEMLTNDGLSERNFYDDYGAQPGDADFHPYNRYISPLVIRDWNNQDHNRNPLVTKIREGGLPSTRFGTNPRNPQKGDEYISRPVFGGKSTSCNVACTGLCHITCDDECSESCMTTCWNRCGDACTSNCGNSCTSCSSQCHTGCKTKCENNTGYSCVKSGAKAVKITSEGGKNGEPGRNVVTVQTHTCTGCSFSCQFYPNKKTECWDSGCMGKCFTSCSISCSTSCYGGCIDNTSDDSDNYNFKTGKGRGCSDGCTLNCIGICSGICEGYCVQTCWHACKQQCSDNCSWTCSTQCGTGCDQGCTKGCTGCSDSCRDSCKTKATGRDCIGCGSIGGCTSNCQFDCNKNCMGRGCRSICGIESEGACESNCRLNCTASSCTAMCSDACSSRCNTCVNTCGFQCGACGTKCSVGCSAECNINCSEECSQNCSHNCVHSCNEECGGCSNLCYSCIGMCIGICSVKCDNGCSSCTNTCGWWCDSVCGRECVSNCSQICISTCVGSCSTFLTSETTMTDGPERPPTAQGYIYPNPRNRWEERESFRLLRDILPYSKVDKPVSHKLINVSIEMTSNIFIIEMDLESISKKVQLVYETSSDKLVTNIGNISKNDVINVWKYVNGDFTEWKFNRIYPNRYVYIWDINTLGLFKDNSLEYLKRDRNVFVTGPEELKWEIRQTSTTGGVYTVDPTTGEITINEDMLSDVIESTYPDISTGGGIFIITLYTGEMDNITDDDIGTKLPFEFEQLKLIHDKDNNIIIVIKRDEFLFPEEEESNGKDQ